MGGVSRVSEYTIPKSDRRIIQGIKEIAGNHSDEDIYGMLRECNMDPDETTQRLLYLGTFHEVKRKRNRQKENSEFKGPADYRGPLGGMRHGERIGQGTYSSHKVSYDVGAGRGSGSRKDGGVFRITKNNVTSDAARSLFGPVSSVPSSTSNGYLNHGRVSQSTVPGVTNLPKNRSPTVNTTIDIAPPQPAVNVNSPPDSSPISKTPSRNKSEHGKSDKSSITSPASTKTPASVPFVSSSSDSVLVQSSNSKTTEESEIYKSNMNQNLTNGVHESEHFSHKVDNLELSLSFNGVSLTDCSYPNHDDKLLQGATEAIKVSIFEAVANNVEANVQSAPSGETTTKIHKKPELIFPNNLHVPESYESGLIFGSLGATFGFDKKDSNCLDDTKNGIAFSESLQDNGETTVDSCPCNKSVSSTTQEEECFDHSQSPTHEGNLTSDAVPKFDQLSQPIPEPQYSVVQGGPTFSYSYVQPLMDNQLVQPEGSEPQTQDVSQLSNVMSGNSAESTSPTPPTGVPAISVSPQPLPPMFRPPYFYPYGHYFSSYYTQPPPLPQFMGHGGFPPQQQQGSGGSLYLTAAAAASGGGMKYSMPQYKVGGGGASCSNNGGGGANLAQVGVPVPVPAGFGGPAHHGMVNSLGYGQAAALGGRNPAGIESLAVSQAQSKDGNGYVNGHQSEGSAVWFPGPTHDISTMQQTPYCNFTPQAQHMTLSPFSGLYHPMPPTAAPHPLLQPSQPDKIRPLMPPYQQQQHLPLNWNPNY